MGSGSGGKKTPRLRTTSRKATVLNPPGPPAKRQQPKREAGPQWFVPNGELELDEGFEFSRPQINALSALVLEELYRRGIRVRQADSPLQDGSARRRDTIAGEAFGSAMLSLSAGDVDAAQASFRSLLAQRPGSDRIRTFVNTIADVRRRAAMQRQRL